MNEDIVGSTLGQIAFKLSICSVSQPGVSVRTEE